MSRFSPVPSGRIVYRPVPAPELFVTVQPKQEDIVGVYQLTQQTITTNGLAALDGRLFQLDLRPDGSFAVTNYPQWSSDPHPTPHVVAFVSTTGRWHSQSLGTVYVGQQGQPFWGVVFSDSDTRIDSLALRGKVSPYGLMMTYGDGDDGTVMMFDRKK